MSTAQSVYQKVYYALVDLNVIDRNKLDFVWNESQQHPESFFNLLLENNLITDENLAKLIADVSGYKYIDISKILIPVELISLIPESFARKHQVILFGSDQSSFNVATINPEQKELFDLLSQNTKKTINLFITSQEALNQALIKYSFDFGAEIQTLLEQSSTESNNLISDLVTKIIVQGFHTRSSDIHFEPSIEKTMIRFRIDGLLKDMLTLPQHLHNQIISRLKVLAKLRTDIQQLPQDGKFHLVLDGQEIDIRLSLVPIVQGEKAVLRILSSNIKKLSLNDLGMTSDNIQKLKSRIKQSFGMILSTGPTGSGKTTSIYSVIKILNSRERNIATIEDPEEYEIFGVNQMLVNPQTGLTFAKGLRAILRQDPDVIFVGEIRDQETADIATNAAMTGHLVLSTLHTNDAATTIPRLIDMGIEPYILASTLQLIIGQRLVRKICTNCRYSMDISHDELTKAIPKDDQKVFEKVFPPKPSHNLYLGKGCSTCQGSGMLGRIGLFELLEISPKIKNLIVAKANSDVIKAQAQEEGMQTIFKDGLVKVSEGITTLDEVIRVTKV